MLIIFHMSSFESVFLEFNAHCIFFIACGTTAQQCNCNTNLSLSTSSGKGLLLFAADIRIIATVELALGSYIFKNHSNRGDHFLDVKSTKTADE